LPARAVEILRDARQRFPADFWINYELARLLILRRDKEATRFATAAVALQPGNARAWVLLGMAAGRDRQDEGIACYRKALALDPKDAAARKALARAERLSAVQDKLPAVRTGEYQPADSDERLALAELCQQREFYRTATRLYAEAFAVDPKLANDMEARHRYNAACHAVLSAGGRGEDVAGLAAAERLALRRRALTWLRAELACWARLEHGPAARAEVQKTLSHWQTDANLAGLRDPAALKALPAEERQACEGLWADVAALLAKAGKK
jgi:tetratricopeptide (TPR) repeat protein